MLKTNSGLKLYCDTTNARHTQHDINKIKFTSNANIVTVNQPTVVIDTKTGAYGVFDNMGKLVKQSLQYRGKNHNFVPRHIPHDTPYIDADAIYIGNIYPHFGHFLVEHLNRLYGGIGQKNIKYIFINNKNIEVKKYVYDFMKIFGIKKQDVIILTTSTRFRKLYIPSQTFNMSGAFIDRAMTNGYQALAKNITGSRYERVYMSRTKLPENMRTIGEERIQKIFEKNGYKIIYPETMTIAQQIAAVRDAKYLAGCAGTALHWALCMKPGGTVIVLKRNTKPNIFIQSQYMINTVVGLDTVFVTASIEKHSSGHGGKHAPQIIGVNNFVKKFFDDFGFKYTKHDIEFDKKSMETYIAQYKKYEQEHCSALYNNIFRHIIKIAACFVPGRINRKNFRNWLKNKIYK